MRPARRKTWNWNNWRYRAGILTRPSDRDERDLVPNLRLWAHFEWQHADWRVSHNPPVSAIDLSLRTHFRHFNRLRITLWGTLLDASPAGGVSDHMQKRGKTWFHFLDLRVWFWYDTVRVYIRHSNQKFLVNYCPLVFIPLLYLRFLGWTHLHSKLLLTGDVDPVFWGVTVRLTCVAYWSTKSLLFHKGLSHTFSRLTPVFFSPSRNILKLF